MKLSQHIRLLRKGLAVRAARLHAQKQSQRDKNTAWAVIVAKTTASKAMSTKPKKLTPLAVLIAEMTANQIKDFESKIKKAENE